MIYRRPAPPDGEVPPIDAEAAYEVVLDPHPMSADLTTRVDILSPSPEGKYLLYSVRDGGEDEIEVRVRDLEAGADLPDRLPRALYDSVFFSKDGEGFYYTHRSRETGSRVRFHRLGSPMDEDRILFGEGIAPTSFVETLELEDGERPGLLRPSWLGEERPLLQGAGR